MTGRSSKKSSERKYPSSRSWRSTETICQSHLPLRSALVMASLVIAIVAGDVFGKRVGQYFVHVHADSFHLEGYAPASSPNCSSASASFSSRILQAVPRAQVQGPDRNRGAVRSFRRAAVLPCVPGSTSEDAAPSGMRGSDVPVPALIPCRAPRRCGRRWLRVPLRCWPSTEFARR